MPSALILFAFALGATAFTGPFAEGVLHGLKLVAVAVVAQAIWGMANSLTPDRARAAIALAAVAIVVFIGGSFGQIGAIASAAVAGLWLCRGNGSTPAGHLGFSVSRGHGAIALVLFAVLFLITPLVTARTGSQGLALFDAFYRSGSLVFGGGHVVLPLLQAEVVTPGWVSNADFLAGYGMAQAVPGPLFTFAAYLGASVPLPMVSPVLRLHSSPCPCRGCCWSTACCRIGTRYACVPLRKPPCAGPMPPSSASLAPHSTIRSGPAPCSPRAISPWRSRASCCSTVWKLAPWIVVVLLAATGAILRLT